MSRVARECDVALEPLTPGVTNLELSVYAVARVSDHGGIGYRRSTTPLSRCLSCLHQTIRWATLELEQGPYLAIRHW